MDLEQSTIEQIHRVVDSINKTFDEKSYCIAVCLDVSQNLTENGINNCYISLKKIPEALYILLKSYLTQRYFRVSFKTNYTILHPMRSGLSQGSVLGTTLYLIFTTHIPTNNDITTSMFAYDTEIIAIHRNLTATAAKF